MKKKYIQEYFFILLLWLGASSWLYAQDIHFSQVGNAPLNISPALTAVFGGDIRATANYRSQWESVPVPYLTFSGAYEMKFLSNRLPNGFFGGGLLFNYDKAGHADLSLSQLGINLTYTHRVSKKNFLTGGFQGSVAQRMFKPQALTFDSQYNGDQFDAGTASGEIFEQPDFFFLNYSAGLNWHFQQPTKRTRVDVGFSAFNLNEAQQSFYEDQDIRLRRRFHAYGLGSFKVGERVDLGLLALVAFQEPAQEKIFGASLKYYFNAADLRVFAVQFGVNFRIGDAVIPTFEIDFRNILKVGVSYDVNTSGFATATGRRGSPEFSLIYTINKVKPLEKTKICPLY